MASERDMRDLLIGAIGGAVAGFAAAYYWRREIIGRSYVWRRDKPSGGTYHAGMIKAKPGMIEQYMQLHDATWDEVMARMHRSNMRDFTVWLHEASGTMFHQFVYVGDDFDADMAAIDSDPIVRFWWTYCEPCQQPLSWSGPPPSQGGKGEWWSPLKQVNHCGGWSTAWSNSLGPNPSYKPCHPRGLTSTKDSPPAVHNRPEDGRATNSARPDCSFHKRNTRRD